MKSLLLVVFSAVVLASSSHAADSDLRYVSRDQRRSDVAAGRTYDGASGTPENKLKELKDKYKNGGQRTEIAPTPGPEPIKGIALSPALYARYAKGPNGYTLEHLVENLKLTEKNLGALVDYIRPWREGIAAPTGEDRESALKRLAGESAAAKELIVEADAAVAKGIPRDPKDPNDTGLRKILGHLSRPSFASTHHTPEILLQEISLAQANVLGHSAALIEFKRLNPPDAEGESRTEGWLEGARKSLAARLAIQPE